MGSFAKTLRHLRTQRGLRQADLAAALELSQATIANYEQGIRFPDEDVLNRLADRLGVSADTLLGRGRPPLPSAGVSPGDEGAGSPRAEALTTDSLAKLLIEGNAAAFAGELDRLRAAGWSAGMIHRDLIHPLMYEIGRRWEAGQIDVFQEHAVTEEMRRQLARLHEPAATGPRSPRFLGFSVSGNLHDLGIRMVSDLLAETGWNTLFLGSNVPPASLIAAVRDFQPQVVGISAALDQHLAILQQTIYFLRREFGTACPAIMVGGFAFSASAEMASTMGADAFAFDSLHAIDIANSLVATTAADTGGA